MSCDLGYDILILQHLKEQLESTLSPADITTCMYKLSNTALQVLYSLNCWTGCKTTITFMCYDNDPMWFVKSWSRNNIAEDQPIFNIIWILKLLMAVKTFVLVTIAATGFVSRFFLIPVLKCIFVTNEKIALFVWVVSYKSGANFKRYLLCNLHQYPSWYGRFATNIAIYQF